MDSWRKDTVRQRLKPEIVLVKMIRLRQQHAANRNVLYTPAD